MQRLPKEVFSVHGNMPLKRGANDCPDDSFGVFDADKRYVAIHPGTAREKRWPTFWHECTHVALDESGCSANLSASQQEAICDAMGLYLAAMMRAGMLRVVTPKHSS